MDILEKTTVHLLDVQDRINFPRVTPLFFLKIPSRGLINQSNPNALSNLNVNERIVRWHKSAKDEVRY